jgi:outer membrane usher protein
LTLAAAVAAVPPLVAHAQTPDCQAGVGRAATVAPLLVQPLVNGEEREVMPVRFLAPAGPLYIGEPQLKDWGIAPEKLSLLNFSGARWLCVEGIGLQYKLDPAQLTLALDFPPELYGGSRASFVMEDRLPVTYAPGGFLNYDLRYDRSAGVASLGANWEIGAFARAGLLTSSFFSGDNGRGTIRLDTAFRRDDPERITSAIAGDTISRAGSYGASVRMGGLQYRRDFATAPLLVTYPQADVSGTAVVPSTVDVFIGNAKAYSTQVKPGPFSLQNLPVPVGAGNVRVVTRDIFGRETATVVPYVRYDSMLKQGLHDFSYEAGYLRRNYAVTSNDYGDFAAVATHRYGVTNALTVEGHAEAMADRGNLGGVVQVTMPVLGLAGIGAAASTGNGTGKLGKAFFQRNELNWSVGAAVQQQSQNYVDVASEPGQIRTLGTRQVSASARVDDRNWVNVLGLRTYDRTGSFNTATLGWTLSLTPSATLTASWSRFSGSLQATNDVFAVFLSMPLGERDYASASVERRSNPAETNALLNVSRNLLETDSFGYRVLAGQQSDARRLELGAFARTGVGEFGIEAADAFGTRATRAYARGGVAAAGGEWRISRYLDQSFALVKVADFKDVQVYANSQPVGKTDASGVAVIPRLAGFLPNRITFEAEDIPLEGAFGENVQEVKIANRMGVVVNMGVVRSISATLTLVEAGGKPVPAGASARVGEATEEFPVARQGRVYVSGLDREKPNVLQVRIGERACRATVELPKDFASGSTLGSFTCR